MYAIKNGKFYVKVVGPLGVAYSHSPVVIENAHEVCEELNSRNIGKFKLVEIK